MSKKSNAAVQTTTTPITPVAADTSSEQAEEQDGEEQDGKKTRKVRAMESYAYVWRLLARHAEFYAGTELVDGTLAAQELVGKVMLQIQDFPEDWGYSARMVREFAPGDKVALKQTGKVQAIYADCIAASDLDRLVVAKAGKMTCCTIEGKDGKLFIQAAHLTFRRE